MRRRFGTVLAAGLFAAALAGTAAGRPASDNGSPSEDPHISEDLHTSEDVPAAAPNGDPTAQAIDLLQRAAKAIGAIDAVRYTAKIEPGGVGETFWPRAEGEALLVGWNPTLRRPAKFYVHLDTRSKGSEEVVPITMGGDGETFFVINHGEKRGYEDIDPGVLGKHQQTLSRFEVTEFVLEEPYEDEIHANHLELLGTESFRGEECYKVHVKYSAGRGEATWLFAVGDLLPRYRIQSFSIPQGDGSLAISLSGLDVRPEFRPDLFKMDLPPGYQQIDDFAP